jgi:nucleotide-binding universal stress UspA family protein
MSRAIVCGIDLANGGEAVAKVAATLACALDGRAVLIHVMDPPSRPPERGLPSLRRARHLGRLRAIVDDLGLPHGTSAEVLAGEPADQLMRRAANRDAELIVLGSSGLLEIGSALRGSVPNTLMRTASCPVVVVPPDATAPSAIASVVCGVEGGRHDVNLLRLGWDLGQRLSATVRAVHAFNPGPAPAGAGVAPPIMPELRDAADKRIRRAIAEAGIEARPSVLALPPAEALIRAAEEEDAGLIAVASQGRGKLGSILLGSVSLRLAATAPVPVVVLPPRAELAAGSGHYEVAAVAA